MRRPAAGVLAALVLLLALLAVPAWSATPTGGPITPGGTAVIWGDDTYGEISDIPALAPGVRWVSLAGGLAFVVGLTSDGQVKSWGANGAPAVPSLFDGLTYVAIGASYYKAYAVRSDGTVVQWGAGQPTATPPAPGPGLRFVQVVGGNGFALALRSDGMIVGWGADDDHELDVPSLPTGLTYTQVAAGFGHGAALRSDGRVVTWGNDDDGQVSATPAPPDGVSYTKVVADDGTTYALRSDGRIDAWGFEQGGNLTVPALPSGVTYTDVGTGDVTGYAIRSDGQTVAWGLSGAWQLGSIPAAPAGMRYGLLGGNNSYNGFGILQAVASITAASTPARSPAVTVHVTAVGGTVPTGRVKLFEGGTGRGEAELADGRATITPTGLGVGTHHLSVVYGGDAGVVGGTVPVTVTVLRLATRTTLKVKHRAHRGLALTITVSNSASGRVTVLDGGHKVSKATLHHGKASVRLKKVKRGRHQLRAVYAGSSAYAPSTSKVVKVRVR